MASASGSWEDILSLYTWDQPTTRDQVAGSGEGHASWFAEHTVVPRGADAGPPGGSWDIGWYIPYVVETVETDSETLQSTISYDTLYYQVGLRLAREVGSNDAGTPLSRFVREPLDLLWASVTEAGTDVVKLLSFDSAGMTVRGVEKFLADTHQRITGWARDLDVSGSDLQGSAAGALKDALTGIANEFQDLAVQMTMPREFSGLIDDARSRLQARTGDLQTAYDTWRASPEAWPANHVRDILQDVFNSLSAQAKGGLVVSVGQTPVFTDPTYGNPMDQSFWDRVEDQAKTRWKNHVSTTLDPQAATALSDLENAYGTAAGAIPHIAQPKWRTPGAAHPADGPKDPAKSSLDDLQKQLEQSEQDQQKALDDAGKNPGDGRLDQNLQDQKDLPGGGQKDGDGTGAGPVVDQQSLKNALQKTGEGGTFTDGTTKTGGTDGTGGDARSALDKLPPGAVVNKDGTVTGPDGKPLKNQDGTLRKVSPGAYDLQQQRLQQQNEQRRQQALQKTAQEQEKAYQDQLRQRRQALQKAADEQEKSYQEQLRKQQLDQQKAGTQQRAYQDALRRARLGTRTSGADLHTLENARNLKGGFRVRQPDGSLTEHAPATEEQLRPGRSARIRTSSGGLGALAPEEAALTTGRRTSSNPPMMPPMGSGAGAGAGGADQGRERKSFLDEEEETWGTQASSGTGVIG
ncbi:hypothetical protein A8713_01345 [Streptomyces sp. SAT1]|uniref:hypothetical protein n=1 Tax=Streptomyces sp. SAT1 TaxID=1849967 RepID=UPI0007DD51FE|nr:hypothetical protein [Streptomyces sp. SAT1]ANH89944.1 hypothetical protein A8713_01345 [Streptomyces sp. SAT1]